MTTHQPKTLAELNGTLMSVDIDDVEVGDVMFMGGHLVRRVGTRPSERPFRVGQDGFRNWQPLKLDATPDDASTSSGYFQTAEGQACLILRPAVAPIPGDDYDTRPGIVVMRGQLNEFAGRVLSDAEVERIDAAWPNSSVPEALGTIADSIHEDDDDPL